MVVETTRGRFTYWTYDLGRRRVEALVPYHGRKLDIICRTQETRDRYQKFQDDAFTITMHRSQPLDLAVKLLQDTVTNGSFVLYVK